MREKTLTIDDLLCMLDEIEPGQGRRGYELLVETFRQGPQAALYAQIEQMSDDARIDRRKIGWEREAVLHHRHLDRLLTLEPHQLALELAEGIDMETADFHALLRLCAARRARGEGDAEKLAGLEQALATYASPASSLDVGEALQKLDTVIVELVDACTSEMSARLAHTRAVQYLLARVMRELRASAGPHLPLPGGSEPDDER